MRKPPTLVRIGLTLVLVVGGAGLVVSDAAGLSTSSRNLGAAQVATPRCSGSLSGIGLTENVPSGTSITTVTLTSVPASCDGAALVLTVSSGSTTGAAAWTVAGTGTTLTLSTSVPLTSQTQADLVMTGP
ncbi:MAG TPA: hypothetical protein VEK76_13145 [Candidatus Binatia bacterium]|nr:hypothetical protein [Candidatus Binatia bacterium]